MKSIKLLFLSLLIAFSFSLTADAYNFTRDLESGSRGEDVTQLQQVLVGAGYLSSDLVTGYFGESTKNALIRWQVSRGVSPAAGYFGALSRRLLSNSGSSSNSSVSVTNYVSNTSASSDTLSDEQIRWVADTLLKERIINRNKYNKVIDALSGPADDLTVTYTKDEGSQKYKIYSPNNSGEVKAWKLTVETNRDVEFTMKAGGGSGTDTMVIPTDGKFLDWDIYFMNHTQRSQGATVKVWAYSDYNRNSSVKEGDLIGYGEVSFMVDPTSEISPTASLKINGSSDLTVTPGQNYTYSWTSTNGKSFSAKWETISSLQNYCGGSSGSLNYINNAAGSKDGLVKILTSHAGCVWKITYEVTANDGSKAESVAFLRVPAIAGALAPTASLLVNNSSNVTVNPGDRYVYSWTSTNGETASGKWTSNDSSKCVAASGIMRGMNTLRGSYTATDTITSAHAGCVWTVTYEVKNAYGEAATSVVTVRVPNASTPVVVAPTASLKISNQSNLTVRPGDSYNYSWTSTNGASAKGTWRTTSGDTAKCGTSGNMYGMNTLIGSLNQVQAITASHAGCVWEVKYEVTNSAGTKAESVATLRVPN